MLDAFLIVLLTMFAVCAFSAVFFLAGAFVLAILTMMGLSPLPVVVIHTIDTTPDRP